jgi:hypothetical protein
MKLQLVDWIRVALIFLLLILLIYMVKEIEAVKFLLYDPCKVCMEKSGAFCYKF